MKIFKLPYFIFSGFIILLILALTFTHFGGFHTGNSLNIDEFKTYANSIYEISIPQDKKIIALGEATHGNKEFQQLKLDMLKILVEKYGIRSFAIEGDFGGCEEVNQYIHGGSGTAKDAVEKIGFKIYKTEEMIRLIEYMRDYNKQASENEDLRFYGFDMQKLTYSAHALKTECKNLNIDTSLFDKLIVDGALNKNIAYSTQLDILELLKKQLKNQSADELYIHYVDMLLQNIKIMSIENKDGGLLRDKFMASNIEWILSQEEQRGNTRIFISGHNEHIAKWESYDSMGKLLSNNLNNGYYAIGTDFYKTDVNLPKSGNKRTIQTFYSHNPLAKTAKLSGYNMCWLNFSTIPQNTELYDCINDYIYLGTLGESYSPIMRLLPPSYRMFQPPAVLYDSMIIVSYTTPIKIID